MLQTRFIDKLNMALSPLGFGVMRLDVRADGTFPPEVHRLLAAALEQGINYFDTAYMYLGGHSEELIRDALVAAYPRDRFCIADKLPVWECSGREDMERIFQTQLKRLGVEYIDFYLLHGLNRFRWTDIYEKGVVEFLESKKREGSIRKVGFSMHDNAQALKEIVNAYDWDFAQLQINYYDWTVQHAKENYDLLEKHGIPCMVMEPVGGGRLAKLPAAAESLLKAERPDDSLASWAVRFSASLPNVAVTLSGMSDLRQLNDNIMCFEKSVALSERELSVLNEVVCVIGSYNTIPCTSCCYCAGECGKEIDIPQIFQRYNDSRMFDNMTRFDACYFTFIPEGHRADACIACGKCVKNCPQMIDIPQQLKMIHETAVGLSLGINMEKLRKHLKREKATVLVCFGAGDLGKATQSLLHSGGLHMDYYCDNANHLWNTELRGVPVISPGQLKKLSRETKLTVLITSTYYDEIKTQLNDLEIPYLSNLYYS